MLNISGIGKAICKLIPKNTSSKEKPIIFYVASREEVKANKHIKFFDKYTLDEEDEDDFYFQIIPFVSSENPRNILYTTGQSGSGKSYHTSGYIMEYNKLYPKNQVYVFSALREDKAFTKCKNINRVDIKSDDFEYSDFTIADFKDSLVIYDDTDNISNPAIKNN
jgi:hypothetical protein